MVRSKKTAEETIQGTRRLGCLLWGGACLVAHGFGKGRGLPSRSQSKGNRGQKLQTPIENYGNFRSRALEARIDVQSPRKRSPNPFCVSRTTKPSSAQYKINNWNQSSVMLMLNPGGGAMVLKSVGMFLERGRRGSAPQAHSLLHQATQAKSSGKPAAEESPREGELEIFHLSASEIIWSRKLRPRQRQGIMAEESKKTGNKSQPKLIENFRKKTHFSRQEVEALCRIYRDLLSSSTVVASKAPSSAIASAQGLPPSAGKVEGLDRIVFRELVHNAFDLVTEEVLVDRIFCAFDRNNDGVIKQENWICGLSTFLRGTLEERAAFCFMVYDLNADGYITRDEMMHLLRNCLMKSPQDEDPEEGVRDLVELVLRKMDVDKDGKISYQDFLEAVTTEPLMLEALGQCLPTEAACQSFISTLRS